MSELLTATWHAIFLYQWREMVQVVTNMSSILAIVVGGGWTLWMLHREIRNFRKTVRASHYSELDRSYTDILLQTIDRPHLRDRRRIPEYIQWIKQRDAGLQRGTPTVDNDDEFAEQAQAYETYAFVTMNFVETIRDRCFESVERYWDWAGFRRRERADELLIKTWKPIIEAECSLHGEWFSWETRRENRWRKFCLGFCDFVQREGWAKNAVEWGDRPDEEILKVQEEVQEKERRTTLSPNPSAAPAKPQSATAVAPRAKRRRR